MAGISQASIGISDCWVKNGDEETHYPEAEAFRAFELMFRPVESSETEERARKRRKLSKGYQENTESFDSSKSAVLFKLTLDLEPTKCQILPSLSNDARASVPLELKKYIPTVTKGQKKARRFEPDSETHRTISIFDPASSATIDFKATAAPKMLESLKEHLHIATSVGAEWDWQRYKSSSNKAYIPFVRCNLLRHEPDKAPQLEVELRWPFGISAVDTLRSSRQHRACQRILSTYLPDTASEDKTPWSLSDFYDAVHVPPNKDISPRIENSLPSTDLYPYQQRSVDWMLRREGMAFSPAGELHRVERTAEDDVPVSFSATHDSTGRKCYVSYVRGMIIADLKRDWDSTSLHGGILAEEMGLGKSVELISLMCLNKREITGTDIHDPYLDKMVKVSGATLIITPPTILEQWGTEINRHAPHLKVFHYKGMSKHKGDEATVDNLLRFDVVLTSYTVFSTEIHHVIPPPDRSSRHKKVHERRGSPLVDISWWRICLDEAQMVENGASQAAKVARMIPRCNAWAVSGTPLRNNVMDLAGLFVFLRCEPFASFQGIFKDLDKASFRDLINRMVLRHTKDQVRSDLDIPPQKRIVVTIPFTAIEEEYYADMFRQMCEACFLSPEGTPLREDRTIKDPETIERMREWLVRLRQTCLHSHVGEKNRKALGPKKQPLRTVQEVLQVMIDQNETKLKSEARELIIAQMRRGHIYSFAKNVSDSKEQAISYYKEALETTLDYVKLGRKEIEVEVEMVRTIDPNDASDHESSDDEDEKDETNAKFARLTVLRRALRFFLELEHACYFFIGNMYYQWKENIALTTPDSVEYKECEDSEKEWYDKALLIRQELLKDTETRTQQQMQKVKDMRGRHQDVELPEVEDLGGIESRNVLDQLDSITEVINLQSAKLKEWRNKIIEILTLPLVDNTEEKEITGQEYETSLNVQDELYVYIQAFRTIVADMATAVHGTEDALVNHEMEQAVKQTRDEDPTRRGHAPELLLRLSQERTHLRPKPEHGSLRGVVASARQVVASLEWRAGAKDKRASVELDIVQKYFKQVQDMFTVKTELAGDLEKELEQFRLTMNLRLEFYRQIQHISETVEDYKDEMDEIFDIKAFTAQTVQIEARRAKIQRTKVRQTYLNNLREVASKPEEVCNICLESYERGILTTCGHKVSAISVIPVQKGANKLQYCRTCILTWWKINHNCPECRTALTRKDMKEIAYETTPVTAQEEHNHSAAASSAASSSSSSPSIYSDIHNSTMNEIKTVKLIDSYGSKVDMMARHLLWIRNNDPGAKTIIYSQFADFLQVLYLALKRFKIGVSGIREKKGIERFKTDPSVECFLLDAKSNSSGLNLVNATYVFLCEPLINPALELQAIARVHRIGQKRTTTVFMYIVGNTVEERIYEISVKRRLEHMGRDAGGSRLGSANSSVNEQAQERSLEVANSEAIKNALINKLVRQGNQGEVVVAEDLWECLFGIPKNVPTLEDRHEIRVRREPFLEETEDATAEAQV